MSSPRKIILKSSDGEKFEVDEAVALESQMIKHMIENGRADNRILNDDWAINGIPLLNVTSQILAKVIEYNKKHVESRATEAANNRINHNNAAAEEDLEDRDTVFMNWFGLGARRGWRVTLWNIFLLGARRGWRVTLRIIFLLCGKNQDPEFRLTEGANNKINHSNADAEEDLKNWDAEFVMVNQATLFDLILAANYLNIKGLFDLTTQVAADMAKGMTPEELRKFFNEKNDFTPEEEEEERLEDVEKDQREYTLDEEDQKLQTAILQREPSAHETMVLKKTLSSSYTNMGFNEALKKENEKLQRELQISQANMDFNQVEVIQRLIDVTETVAAGPLPEESSPKKLLKKVESNYSDADSGKHQLYN